MGGRAPARLGDALPSMAFAGWRSWIALGPQQLGGPAGCATGGVTLVLHGFSGFLITGLLREEQDGTGKINLRGFWLRRARRLIPAFALFLLAMAAAGTPPAHLAVAGLYLADIPFFTADGYPGSGTCGAWPSRNSSTSPGP